MAEFDKVERLTREEIQNWRNVLFDRGHSVTAFTLLCDMALRDLEASERSAPSAASTSDMTPLASRLDDGLNRACDRITDLERKLADALRERDQWKDNAVTMGVALHERASPSSERSTATTIAIEQMRDFPDGSYMRCPFCGAKSSLHTEKCPIEIVAAALAAPSSERQSGHERLQRIQAHLVAVGVKDVKFTWAIDVAKFPLSTIEDQAADFLEAYIRGDCREADLIGDAPASHERPRFIDLDTPGKLYQLCRFDNGQWSLREKFHDDVAHRRYLDPFEVALLEAGIASASAIRGSES